MLVADSSSDLNKVFDFLRETILELTDLEEEDITPKTSLDELEMDSLDYVEVQIETKKEFGVKLNPNVFSSGEVVTIEDFCNKVISLQQLHQENNVA